MTAIAERLDALDARAAIARLPHAYATAYARLDVDALASLYTADVQLLDGRRGRTALHEHFARGIRNGPGGGLHTVVLHTGDHLLELDGPDDARGVVYCHVEVLLRDGTGYYQAVRYSDHYRREAGTWRFARQRLHELGYGAPMLTRPDLSEDANWPARQVGRGTVPYRFASWQRFWAGASQDGEGVGG
jgi:ketosteroid isomerase-like protein